MKYIVEDGYGHTFPIINFIDKDDNETDDLDKATSMVVRTPDGGILPVIASDCPLMIYTVH